MKSESSKYNVDRNRIHLQFTKDDEIKLALMEWVVFFDVKSNICISLHVTRTTSSFPLDE